jgi:chromosomal replication initiator protein
MPDAADTWSRVQEELRRSVDPGEFEMWLSRLEPRALAGATLVVAAPDARRGWVAQRFGRVLQRCATAVLGPEGDIEVVAASAAVALTEDPLAPPVAGPDARPDLNPKLTFDQFVIGDGNRLAHAAALTVAELPGTAYNPLFLYGPPGTGKTHLLQSIASYLDAYGSGLRVRYTTAERFTNEFLRALQSREIERFKGSWRANDVLLIDDVQFLESKAKTEEEFFHTFNALIENGAQLVLTCDRLPRDMDALEDRLRERFESGLVTEIALPDRCMRTAILRKRAQVDGLPALEPAVLDVIADRIGGSVRELEGALIRTVAYSSLTGRELTAQLAEHVLDGLYPGTARRPGTNGANPRPASIPDIQDVVCAHFAITREQLLSKSRTARLAMPRQLAMYLARTHTKESLPAIGEAFGGRNHTTVMHAVKKVTELLADDEQARETVRTLTDALRADRRD